MQSYFAAVAIGAAMLVPPAAFAADNGSAADAVAMTKKAIAFLKAHGQDKAFAEFSNPANASFHQRDLYVYVYDMKGVCLVNGANPKMAGKNLLELRDGDGKYIIKGFIDMANSAAGMGWVEYKWPNPLTKTVDAKAGYVEKFDQLIVGSGIYK
jgi:cytochrome c